jgi:hypothetical protein
MKSDCTGTIEKIGEVYSKHALDSLIKLSKTILKLEGKNPEDYSFRTTFVGHTSNDEIPF